MFIVMNIKLSPEEKQELEVRHNQEKNHRKADRIKSVLLRDEGWSLSKIAQALRLHNDTVSRYILDYLEGNSFDFNYKGSSEQLSKKQSEEVIDHLEETLYTKVVEIVSYVESKFKLQYTVSGMTDWLKRNNFSYKSPKGTPSKADVAKQKEFIDIYGQLKELSGSNDEPILFFDGVHPSMQTKVSHGWIRKGQDKEIPTTASKTRINILGAINLDDMSVVAKEYESNINGASVVDFCNEIKEDYADKQVIHVILDQAGYNKATEVREHAFQLGIHLHYLPPYSPNLNAIERLWKVMNEETRNNIFFKTAKEFKSRVRKFIKHELPDILPNLRSRITDNFYIKKTAN